MIVPWDVFCILQYGTNIDTILGKCSTVVHNGYCNALNTCTLRYRVVYRPVLWLVMLHSRDRLTREVLCWSLVHFVRFRSHRLSSSAAPIARFILTLAALRLMIVPV